MRNLIFGLISVIGIFLGVQLATADNGTDLTQSGASPELAAAIDKIYSTAITSSEIPKTTNTIDMGSLTKVYRKLFLGTQLNFSFEVVAGAGTTVADAAALSASKIVHQITGANGTVGWKFPSTPAGSVGQVMILLNTTAGVAKIYAASGGTVNGGSVDAAFSALTGIKPIICIATAADTWICS